MPTDKELLHRFIQTRDQDAFAELVRRHVNWINSMASRLTHDRALADDVTQAVFLLLSQKARSLRRETVLSTWLFTVTRYASSAAMRKEIRHRSHERKAAQMREDIAPASQADWQQLSPLLDELVAALRSSDQRPVLLRFYEQKSFSEIGQILQISEEAARKRVSRAVEQLRTAFARRGITVGAAALTATMSANLTQPASAAAIASATSTTIATASTSSMIKSAAAMLTWAWLKPALIAAVCAIALGSVSLILIQQSAPAQNQTTAPPSSAPSTAPVAAEDMRYGQVLTEDDKPVAGARLWQVRYVGLENRLEVVAKGLTDSQGRFAFTAVKSGDGKFVDVMVEPAADRALSGGLIYSPIASSPTEFRARAPASVRVRFLDPAGKPAAGMRVKLAGVGESRNGWNSELISQLNASYTQTTDAQGACTFTGIPRAGMAWFDILDDRYAQVGYSRWVTLNSDALFEADPIKLELGASISGRLTFGDTGKSAAGVEIMSTGNHNLSADAMTDDQGRYRMTQLHPGTYSVFACLTPELSHKVSAVAIQNIQLQAGTRAENQDLSLISGGIVRGKITDVQSGKPLKDVGVFIDGPSRPLSTNTTQETTTDADGVYFMHVPPGVQHVSASRLPPGVVDTAEHAYPQITVADGQTVDVDFKLVSSPAAELRGRTVDPQGNPLSGVEVYVQRNDDPPGGYVLAVSDKDGHFSIPLVDSTSRLRGRRGNWSTLQATTPGDKEITLTLHPDALASLHVAVRSPDGSPVRGAEITLEAAAAASRSMMVDQQFTGADGICTFKRLAPDLNYNIFVTADDFGMARAKASIKPGAQTDLPIVLPIANSFVSGIVVNDEGLPVADMPVSAGSQGYLTRHARTDFTGHFRIDKLVASEPVTILAEDEDHKRAGSALNVAAGSDNVVITVKSH